MTENENMQRLLDDIGSEKYQEMHQSMYQLDCLGCLIFRANRLMVNLLSKRFKSAGYNITVEQFQILLHLWEEDGILQSDLAASIRKDKAGLARTLDIMERKYNLIVRITPDNDHRQKRVHLTNMGKELKDILIPHAVYQHLDYLDILGEEKIETVRHSLMQLLEEL